MPGKSATRLCFAFAVTTLLLSSHTCFAQVQPTNLQAARDGEYTYFQVDLPGMLHPNVAQTFARRWGIQQRYGIRLALLESTPAYETPCYVTMQRENWPVIYPTDTFIGRTRQKGPLRLKLMYPAAKGQWKQQDITLDLSKASPLGNVTITEPDTADANFRRIGVSETQTSYTLTPYHAFYKAQADWMDTVGTQLDDPAGFFTYASLVSRLAAGLKPEVTTEFMRRNPDFPRENLYETATGAQAIQESLQTERALGQSNTTEPRTIDISQVRGVETKSHPFEEMRKGREPKFTQLARWIPEDQYFLRFTSVARFQEFADLSQQWGQSVLQFVSTENTVEQLRARFQKQLCLPATLLSKLLGPTLVKEMAITGSDPFFREGTDVTVLFDTRQPALFKAAVDTYWKAAMAEQPGLKSELITLEGAPADSSTSPSVERLLTPDRSISAYRTFQGNMVIYSNSLAALRNVMKASASSTGTLAQAPDFQYMRTLWPQDDAQEDGFLYLSDAFIRKLVGPATKIKEKRRLESYGALRMVTNAAMLHGYYNGPGATPSFEEMVKEKLLDPQKLALPEPETLSWDEKTATAKSTLFGTLHFLTPLCEVPIDKITSSEQREYNQFRERYEQYWRRYFDPIGVRIKMGARTSFDVQILPLINESRYNELKGWTGDKPQKFDLSRVPEQTVFRWQVALDREARETKTMLQQASGMLEHTGSSITDWIGNWATLWAEDGKGLSWIVLGVLGNSFPEEELAEEEQESMLSLFDIPVAAGVNAKNRLSLTAFLVALKGMVNSVAPNQVSFVPQPPYHDVTLVKIEPRPEFLRHMQGGERESTQTLVESDGETTTPGIYYGAIGDGWYISPKERVLEHVVDQLSSAPKEASPREIEYSMLMLFNPSAMKQSRPALMRGLERMTRRTQVQQLYLAWLLERCGLVKAEDELSSAAVTYLGNPLAFLPGERVSYDAASDQMVSSLYGPMRQPKRLEAPPKDSRLLKLLNATQALRGWLRFTEDGLLTHVELDRTNGR